MHKAGLDTMPEGGNGVSKGLRKRELTTRRGITLYRTKDSRKNQDSDCAHDEISGCNSTVDANDQADQVSKLP